MRTIATLTTAKMAMAMSGPMYDTLSRCHPAGRISVVTWTCSVTDGRLACVPRGSFKHMEVEWAEFSATVGLVCSIEERSRIGVTNHTMSETYDAIVIGIVGGSVVTEEIHPGFRISTVSYVVSLLQSKVIRDLELRRHGFEMLPLDGALAVCGDDYIFFTDDEEHDRREVERFSTTDFGAIERFSTMVQEIGAVLRNQMLREPPKLDAGFRDITALAGMGMDIRKLSPEQRYRLAQMLTGSARNMIERWFESPMVRSMYASDCFSGNFASLDQPGSAIPFFHMAIGELDGELGAWRLVKGGMGGITQAMASFARSRGVEIRTDAPVEKIRIENGRAVGVELRDGERC